MLDYVGEVRVPTIRSAMFQNPWIAMIGNFGANTRLAPTAEEHGTDDRTRCFPTSGVRRIDGSRTRMSGARQTVHLAEVKSLAPTTPNDVCQRHPLRFPDP